MKETDRDELYQRAVKAKERAIALSEYEVACAIRDLLKVCQEYETLKSIGKKRRKVPLQ